MSKTDLIRRWVSRNRQLFTPSTCTIYTGVIWRFGDFMPDDVKHLTVEHIERYIAHALDKEKLSRRTVHNHIGIIKSFCRWTAENYDINNPASKVKLLKYDPPKRRFLSPAEYEKVLGVCDDVESKIIRLLANTGLRAAELQSLQLSNLSHDCKSIRFAGKGRKERIVPLNQTARHCIINGKPSMELLKSYRYRNALYHLCVRLSRRAGIPTFTPHALRRFFGNQLRHKGVDIYTISKLYGHASVQQTEQYLSCSADELHGVTDVLD